MGANQGSNHEMSHTDIAFLLAEAADEVEVGIAPYETVMRGGRRRKARRWAVAAAAALVISGSSAALAVAGLPGGGGDRVAPPAGHSRSAPSALTPHRTTLATGSDGRTEWRVVLDVWPAPRDEVEAQAQLDVMAKYGEMPEEVRHAYQMVGSSYYFVHKAVGEEESLVMWSAFDGDGGAPKDLTTAALPLESGTDGPQRLVVGQVTRGAGQVTCTWKDGTSTVIDRAPVDAEAPTDLALIRPAESSPVDWFVCLAPKGTEYASAEVTRLAD
jgi:hypothetical protein